jgi:hypothetical protein
MMILTKSVDKNEIVEAKEFRTPVKSKIFLIVIFWSICPLSILALYEQNYFQHPDNNLLWYIAAIILLAIGASLVTYTVIKMRSLVTPKYYYLQGAYLTKKIDLDKVIGIVTSEDIGYFLVLERENVQLGKRTHTENYDEMIVLIENNLRALGKDVTAIKKIVPPAPWYLR